MKKNIIIALTVIASLCLLYWGIEYLKGVNLFKPANFYYAHFEKVDGLVEAAPVTVNGFQVGQVREITYDYNTNQIKVMMAMNTDLKIPVGSTVHIVSSLTGAASLALTLSENNVYCKVGDEINGVKLPGIMDKVTGDVLPQVTGILPAIDSIMDNINVLTGNPALYSSVSRLDGITAELSQSAKQLSLLMVSLNKAVPGVVNDVNGITGNLTGATGNLNELSASLKTLPLDSTVAEINSTIANMQRLTAELNNKINDKNSSLGMLLNDKSLYMSADRAVADLDSLLVDIKKNPKRYINVKLL